MNAYENLWPLFVKPQTDELLTSWMIRNAHNHKQKVYTFYKNYLNINAADKSKIFAIDLDRRPRKDILMLMCKHTGLPYQEVYKTTLISYESFLFEEISKSGNSKWILPLGQYHSKNMRNGLQYCPGCLSSDKNPYFRKQWRLSISILCDKCNLLLRDTCWSCGAGINFIRSELGKKNEYNINNITECHVCREDLRKAKSVTCKTDELILQLQFNKYIEKGHTETLNYSHLYFNALYQVCTIIISNRKRAFPLQHKLSKECGITFKPMLDDGEMSFDYLNCRIRIDVLKMASFFLQDWPTRFVRIMQETSSGMHVQFLNRNDWSELPYWYCSENYSPPPLKKNKS